MINELIRRRASVAATVSSIKDARQVLTRLLPARLINLQRLHRPIREKPFFLLTFYHRATEARSRSIRRVDPVMRAATRRPSPLSTQLIFQVFSYSPPHRPSSTVFVPGNFGDGGVCRHRQSADDHPKPHFLFLLLRDRMQSRRADPIAILIELRLIERRNTMHQCSLTVLRTSHDNIRERRRAHSKRSSWTHSMKTEMHVVDDRSTNVQTIVQDDNSEYSVFRKEGGSRPQLPVSRSNARSVGNKRSAVNGSSTIARTVTPTSDRSLGNCSR